MKICDLVTKINEAGKYPNTLREAQDKLKQLIEVYDKEGIPYTFVLTDVKDVSMNIRSCIYVEDPPDIISICGRVYIHVIGPLVAWNHFSSEDTVTKFFDSLEIGIKEIEKNRSTLLKKYIEIYDAE
jgi:hypothetical protein